MYTTITKMQIKFNKKFITYRNLLIIKLIIFMVLCLRTNAHPYTCAYIHIRCTYIHTIRVASACLHALRCFVKFWFTIYWLFYYTYIIHVCAYTQNYLHIQKKTLPIYPLSKTFFALITNA